MSKANSGNQVLITDVSYFYFKPDENRKDVITTLEEWTARLLKPNITEQNRETRKRLGRAKEPSRLLNSSSARQTIQRNCLQSLHLNNQTPTSTWMCHPQNTSPNPQTH